MWKKITTVFLAVLLLTMVSCGEDEKDDDDDIEKTALKDIYASNFLIGNIINNTYMSGKHNEILKTHFNAVTCENDMKPDYIAPTSSGGDYRYTKADEQVSAMTTAGMRVHGHTLVWHSQTPSWMTAGDKAEVEATMVKYINDVMVHFKGKVKSWDVVNEAMKDQGLSDYENEIFNEGKWKEYLRNTGSEASLWCQKIGEDYIYTAFKTARAADPDAILYYNDFGLNGTYKPRAVYNMIKDINETWKTDAANTNANRKLIEGIGMQGHYGSWLNDEANFTKLKGNIEKYLELGIIVDISELDITFGSDDQGTEKNTAMSSTDADSQAKAYAKFFRLLKELDAKHPNQITRVTMWGIDDKTSWKSKGNPCLFDGDLNPKPAFYAVSDPSSY